MAARVVANVALNNVNTIVVIYVADKFDGNISPVFPSVLGGRSLPEPFKSEPAGGKGIRLHHKFVIIDFDQGEGKNTEVIKLTCALRGDINKTFSSNISFISQTVGTNSRGLSAEAKVPAGMNLRPNQVALVRILDYSAPNTIAINVNTLQNDEEGKFVLVAAKEGDKLVARKRKVIIGELYGDQIEIKQGLKEGDQLITEGYQAIYDGQLITTQPDAAA